MPIFAGKGAYKGILGLHLKGVKGRSSHLGYDCYITGSTTGGGGKCRMVLRTGRLPAHITPDMRGVLPTEMWWPQREHPGAHACIDAVLTLDRNSLKMWKHQWPDHQFGYESFLIWCDRAAANGQEKLDGGKLTTTSSFTRGGMPQATYTAPKFPTTSRGSTRIRRDVHEGYTVTLYVTRFHNSDSALRVDVHGTLADNDPILLSRAYVDLITGDYQVIEHHPGRCSALMLPTNLIMTVLGIRAAAPSRTIRREREPEPVTPLRRAVAVSETAREVQAALTSDDFTRFPDTPGSP